MSKNNEKLKLYFKKRKNRVSMLGFTIAGDWVFILVVSALVTLAGLVCAVLLYLNISNGTAFNLEDQTGEAGEHVQMQRQIQDAVDFLNGR